MKKKNVANVVRKAVSITNGTVRVSKNSIGLVFVVVAVFVIVLVAPVPYINMPSEGTGKHCQRLQE
jgi:hypothetical protein